MDARTYVDFRVELRRTSPEELEIRAMSKLGETERPVLVRFTDDDLELLRAAAAKLASKRVTQDELPHLGRDLGAYLLPADAAEIFFGILDDRDDVGLRLRLVCHDPSLASLPWEFSHFFRRGSGVRVPTPLVLDPRVSLVRHDPRASYLQNVRSAGAGQLRVVVATGRNAIPGGGVGEDDLSVIREAFADVRGNVEIVALPDPVTEDDIVAALETSADIFQFIGHGLHPDDGVEGLVVSDGRGGATVLPPERLAKLLLEADVLLAVLCACHSAHRQAEGAWTGVAAALVNAQVPAVLAMQHAIEGSHAVVFEKGLYSGLAAGLTLDESTARGRRRIPELGVLADWGVPVLYTRMDEPILARQVEDPVAARLQREIAINLSHGRELERQGCWQKAADAYRLLLGTAPQQREACELNLRLGACLWHAGDLEGADDHLATAWQLASELDIPELQGEVLLEQGRRAEHHDQWSEATAYYQQAREVFGPDASEGTRRATIALASVERKDGDPQEAIRILETLGPSDRFSASVLADYYDVLGASEMSAGNYGPAIEALEKALDIDEKEHSAHTASATRLLLAEVFLRKGGEQARKDAVAHVQKAIDIYTRASDEVGLSDALTLLGQIEEDAGNYEAAIGAYSRASQLDVASRDLGGEARAYRLLGRTALKRGDNDAAESYFRQAHRLLERSQDDLERAELLVEQGYLHLEELQYAAAKQKFQKVLEIALADGNPFAIAVAQRHLAAAWREEGELRTTVSLLEAARETFEELHDKKELEVLLDDLGEVLLDLNRFTEAEDRLRQSLKLDDEVGSEIGKARSSLLLGRACNRMGRRDEAKSHILEAQSIYRLLKDQVGESDALLELGRWHADDGNLREAQAKVNEALRIDRSQDDRMGMVRCYRALASIYRQAGDLIRAQHNLDDAIIELGDTPDAIEQALLELEAAELRYAKGDDTEAIDFATSARAKLDGAGAAVDSALCGRVVARALARQGRCEEAVRLLELARSVLEEREAKLDINRIYDDLAEVHLLAGDLESARQAVERSLKEDRHSNWRAGEARSRMIQGDIEFRAGDHRLARDRYTAALTLATDAQDEVAQGEVHIRLGEWHLRVGNLADVAEHTRKARRLFQKHHDLRAMSRCHRVQSAAYIQAREFVRAEETIAQAKDCLDELPHEAERDRAPLWHLLGELHAADGDYRQALEDYALALDAFERMHSPDDIHAVLRSMARAHQNLGETDAALACLQRLDLGRVQIFQVVLDSLHPSIVEAAAGPFRMGTYDTAVNRSVELLRVRLHDGARSGPLAALAAAMVELDRDPGAVRRWSSAVDALAAITVAHLVLRLDEERSVE